MRATSLLTWNDKKRVRAMGLAAGLAVGAVPLGALTASAATREPAPRSAVIVLETGGLEPAADRAIARAGGRVIRHIGLIDASVADVPTASIPWLTGQPGVLSVSADAAAHLMSSSYPSSGTGSLITTARNLGVDKVWQAGYTGRGVGVALVDSGVAPVQGLDAPDKVVNGPDLSFDTGNPGLRYLDEYGHGTHMAGIIAGRDHTVSGPYVPSRYNFLGIAPDAHIVNVKVATANGAVDVSQVIAGIDWVVEHKDDPGLNIRVLNLSFGTDSTQDYQVDPLAYAAEMAWRHGVTVVASVGNRGDGSGGVSDPAVDPFVIAVGASSNRGASSGDYSEESYSSDGNAQRSPDLVAPGRSVISLRVPGSYLDRRFGSTGRVGTRFFRGTGTSQATAVTSGVAALLFQKFPEATPDQIKAMLTGNAIRLDHSHKDKSGAGEVAAYRAINEVVPSLDAAAQNFAPSTGTGSLEESRGSLHVTARDGDTLRGEQDFAGRYVCTAKLATEESNGTTWSGGSWSGGSWSGGSWSGGSWSGGSWSGGSWSGGSWSGGSWSGGSWSGGSWSGGSWSGGSWSGGSWSGGSWSGGSWSTDTWA